MSTARELHKSAMALVKESVSAKEQGHEEDSLTLLKKALEVESEAAMMLYAKIDAEPTRSVLFRSAATIAYNCEDYETSERMVHCGLSSINVPLEIKQELNQVKNQLHSINALDESQIQAYNYLQILRKSAINLKVKPATPKYSQAVFIGDIMSVLRVLNSSFHSFLSVSFIQHFGVEKFGEKTHKIISKLNKEFPLLYVNSEFASFGASIATDATIVTNNNYDKEINDWKLNLFEDFKNDVIYVDYQSDKTIDSLNQKYSDEDRNSIYKGIIDIFSDSKNYDVSFTDANYETVIKEGLPLPKQLKEKLVPKIEVITDEKTLVKTIGMSKKGASSIRKSDIIISEELSFAEFKRKINYVTYSSESIEFTKEIELDVIYENNSFSIKFEPFGIDVLEISYEEAIHMFEKDCIEQYFRITQMKETEHSFDTKRILDNFNDYVFAST